MGNKNALNRDKRKKRAVQGAAKATKEKKQEDANCLQLGFSPSQTTANIESGSELVAMYAALPSEDAAFPTSGARMSLSRVEDTAVLEELLKRAAGIHAHVL